LNVQQILSQLEALPPMPAVAVRLLTAAQDPDANLGQVAGWIERDPAMTANVLRACNAPIYGLRARVTSVRQATGLLGLRKIVQIALTVLASRYLTPAQEGYALAAGDLWRSSVTSALAAELLAERIRYPAPGTAYTAGLLQDLGKIVLAEFVAPSIREIRRLTEEEGISWQEAERRVVGVPHPEVGARLLERWGFPETLVESVRYHHRPAEARLDRTLAQISHLADALTMTLGQGVGADGLAYRLDVDSLTSVGLEDTADVQDVLAQLAERVRAAQDLFTLA